MSEDKSFAGKLFDLQIKEMVLEDEIAEMEESVTKQLLAVGFDHPIKGYDYYDGSIEFFVDQDDVLPDAAQKVLRDLGFTQSWINFPNHTDKFYFLLEKK